MPQTPFRHFLFIVFSGVFLAAGYLLIFWTDGWGALAGLFFLLALSAAVLFAIVSPQRRLAFIWPALFLILGIFVGHRGVLLADILAGGAFSFITFFIRRNLQNYINFPFFAVVKPALRNFLIALLFALTVGIYTGISSQAIQTKMEQIIGGFEWIPLPGGNHVVFTDLFEKALEKSREAVLKQNFLAPIIDVMAQERIKDECGEDEACAEKVKNEIAAQFTAGGNTSGEPSATGDSSGGQHLQRLLQEKLARFSAANNLNLIAAVLFFFILLPFMGLIAWVLAVPPYLSYLLFRRIGVIERRERSVQQEFFS